jgi:thioredoxin reductase (NADPH)
MSDNGIYDLIIIGAGPGGLSAAIYAMRAALKTALIEMAAPGGQVNNSDSVENWPGDEHITGAELATGRVMNISPVPNWPPNFPNMPNLTVWKLSTRKS